MNIVYPLEMHSKRVLIEYIKRLTAELDEALMLASNQVMLASQHDTPPTVGECNGFSIGTADSQAEAERIIEKSKKEHGIK